MLGPNKWILFTIVGGVLLSIHIHAIDAPAKSHIKPEIQSFTNQKLGITVENLKRNTAAPSSRRQSRNLVPPYQEFSPLDRVQFIDSRTRNSRHLPGTFGSFRIEIPRSPSHSLLSTAAGIRRRSDEYDDTLGTFPAQQQQSYDINYDFDYANDDNATFGLLSSNYQQFQNKVIPISFSRAAPTTEGQLQPTTKSANIKTNNNVEAIKDESKSSAEASSSSSSSSSSASSATKESSDERSSRMLDENESNAAADAASDNVRFPTDESLPQPEALTARRSGLRFEQNNESEHKQSPPQLHQPYNPFIPQAYSEESLHFGDTIPHFQRPYNDETLEPSNENERISLGNRYYRPFIQPFRDEVTKFGDVNGPITAFNRPVRDFIDSSAASTLVNFPRTSFDSTGGYFESSRPPRHYFPAKAYTEYAPDYAAPKYLQPSYTWKQTRQPRVVFPPPNDFAQGTVGTTYVGNDNIVFR